jgi:hypothetical protein
MTTETPAPTETVVDTTKIVEPVVEKVEEPVEEVFDKDRAMQTIQKLREIEKQAKHEKKELELLKAEKSKREEAEMTESQRLTKQAEEARAENAQLKADILRRDVIAETGLPAIFADRLKGTTKEEMLTDAQELAKTLPTLKVAPKISPTNPQNGSTNETEQQMRERIFGRQGNIFDPNAIRKSGGGVIWSEPKKT